MNPLFVLFIIGFVAVLGMLGKSVDDLIVFIANEKENENDFNTKV